MKQDDETSFFQELERAAKGLSIGGDQSSASELRRLLERLQAGAGEAPDADLFGGERKPA